VARQPLVCGRLANLSKAITGVHCALGANKDGSLSAISWVRSWRKRSNVSASQPIPTSAQLQSSSCSRTAAD
jgi:hypothetical protein